MQIRYAILTPIIMACLGTACTPQADAGRPSEEALNHFRKYSTYTDPGKHAVLFDALPESIDELCVLIKRQLIHPFDAEKFLEELPENPSIEDRNLPTVSLMLEELIRRDGRGLKMERSPRDRLLVACVHHSMLLASILRHRGIPVRIRAGFANYIKPGSNLRVSHVVCEVWDTTRQTWFLVDPDRGRVDFPYDDFEFASETWQLIRSNNLEAEPYISSHGSVARATVHLLCHDLSYIIGKEQPYWEDPPIVTSLDTDISDLDKDQLSTLDQLATLLMHPDEHLAELSAIQNEENGLHYPVE